MTLQLLLVSSAAALAGVCLVLTMITVIARAGRNRREHSLATLAASHRMPLLEIAADEDEDGAAYARLAALPAREWTSLRPTVVTMLGKLRGAPVGALVRLLNDHGEIARARTRLGSRSSIRRARAAHLLGLVRDAESVPALIPLLADPADDVRLVTARSLGRIGDPACAGALLDAVPTTHGRIRVPAWIVAEALMQLGPDIEPDVCRALTSPDPAVRGVAVTVTAFSTMHRAVEVIRQCLHFETDLVVKGQMIDTLGHLGGPADVGLILGYSSRYAPGALRLTCVRALGDLGGDEATDRLLAVLGEEDRGAASLAALTLANAGPRTAAALDAAARQGAWAARLVAAARDRVRLSAAVR